MRLRTFLYTLIAGITLSANPVTAQSAPQSDEQQQPPVSQDDLTCQTAMARIDQNFPTGAFSSCSTSGKKQFTLTIAPEDSGRINCSAWYAFRVSPAQRGRITIKLDYTTCGHRYWPKISRDGINWEFMPRNRVEIEGEGKDRTARISLPLKDGPVFVAGQEILPPSIYDMWLDAMEPQPFVTRSLLGKSAQGRDIEMVRFADASAAPRETVMLVGRQHPPEVSGALAMMAFVDTLAQDTELTRAFRARFETLIVPLLNPDGVVHGHWRHNTGGLDLNRDWGPFTQPETRLMGDLLKNVDDDPARKLRVLIDFHSTNRDVFYTIPDELPTDPELFTRNWLELYQERMPDYEVDRSATHVVGRPISKAYAFDTYGIPGITFELGDDTDRTLIKKIGRESAIAMMTTLLATPAPNPDPVPQGDAGTMAQ